MATGSRSVSSCVKLLLGLIHVLQEHIWRDQSTETSLGLQVQISESNKVTGINPAKTLGGYALEVSALVAIFGVHSVRYRTRKNIVLLNNDTIVVHKRSRHHVEPSVGQASGCTVVVVIGQADPR